MESTTPLMTDKKTDVALTDKENEKSIPPSPAAQKASGRLLRRQALFSGGVSLLMLALLLREAQALIPAETAVTTIAVTLMISATSLIVTSLFS